MTHAAALRYVLRAAVEYPLGLYQVLWSLRADFPDVPEEERAQAGRRAVQELLSRGWIALFLEPWQPGLSVPDIAVPIPVADWPTVLSVPENWEAPRFNTYVTIGASEEGRSAYALGRADL